MSPADHRERRTDSSLISGVPTAFASTIAFADQTYSGFANKPKLSDIKSEDCGRGVPFMQASSLMAKKHASACALKFENRALYPIEHALTPKEGPSPMRRTLPRPQQYGDAFRSTLIHRGRMVSLGYMG